MRVGPAEVLQLGDPRLRRVSRPVVDVTDPHFLEQRDTLHAVLRAFREEHGFGRAMAAPQIGIERRFVAVHLDDRAFTLVDPEITWRSDQQFTLWDDCLSFPDLLVRVRRHRSVSLNFTTEEGGRESWDRLGLTESELLQHEIDHLDGVLAVDRAVDRESLVLREVFERGREEFEGMVDQPPHF